MVRKNPSRPLAKIIDDIEEVREKLLSLQRELEEVEKTKPVARNPRVR